MRPRRAWRGRSRHLQRRRAHQRALPRAHPARPALPRSAPQHRPPGQAGAEFAAPVALTVDALILASLVVPGAAGCQGGGESLGGRRRLHAEPPGAHRCALAARAHGTRSTLEFRVAFPPPAAIDADALALARRACAPGEIAAQIGERRAQARCFQDGAHVYLWLDGERHELTLEDPRTREFTASAATGRTDHPAAGRGRRRGGEGGGASGRRRRPHGDRGDEDGAHHHRPARRQRDGDPLRPGERVPEGSELGPRAEAAPHSHRPYARAGAIHVYGGDFFARARSEWDPESLSARAWNMQQAAGALRSVRGRLFGLGGRCRRGGRVRSARTFAITSLVWARCRPGSCPRPEARRTYYCPTTMVAGRCRSRSPTPSCRPARSGC